VTQHCAVAGGVCVALYVGVSALIVIRRPTDVMMQFLLIVVTMVMETAVAILVLVQLMEVSDVFNALTWLAVLVNVVAMLKMIVDMVLIGLRKFCLPHDVSGGMIRANAHQTDDLPIALSFDDFDSLGSKASIPRDGEVDLKIIAPLDGADAPDDERISFYGGEWSDDERNGANSSDKWNGEFDGMVTAAQQHLSLFSRDDPEPLACGLSATSQIPVEHSAILEVILGQTGGTKSKPSLLLVDNSF
jgi:hypothetical protein